MDKELLTSADLKGLFQISEATLWRKVKAGLIPAPSTICGLKRWNRAEILVLIAPAKPRVRNRVRVAA